MRLYVGTVAHHFLSSHPADEHHGSDRFPNALMEQVHTADRCLHGRLHRVYIVGGTWNFVPGGRTRAAGRPVGHRVPFAEKKIK